MKSLFDKMPKKRCDYMLCCTCNIHTLMCIWRRIHGIIKIVYTKNMFKISFLNNEKHFRMPMGLSGGNLFNVIDYIIVRVRC